MNILHPLHPSGVNRLNSDGVNWLREAHLCQNEFETIYWEWKCFDRAHLEYIKTTIGLIFFGPTDVDDPPSIARYYATYNEERRNIIDKVLEQIRLEQLGIIALSCTFLVCRLIDDRIIHYPVIRCKSLDSQSVRFFDVTTRCYQNWDDFVRSNSLPKCEYLAPLSGVYEYKGRNHRLFSTPSDTWITGTVASFLSACALSTSYLFLSPADVTAAGANVFALGPNATSTALATAALTTSRVLHAASFFIDRRRRSHLHIELPVVTSRSNFLNHSGLIDFFSKVSANEVSFRDVYNFALHLFQVCGLVVRAEDLHNALCQPVEGGTINYKLTAVQEQNIQEGETEARLPGGWTNRRMSFVEIRAADVHTSLKSYALRVRPIGVYLLLLVYPKSMIIFEYFVNIGDLLNRYRYQGLENKEMCRKLNYYVDNVYAILQIDLLRMKQNLRKYVSNPTIADNDSIAQICNNEVDWMYLCAEDITEAVFSTFCGVATDPNPGPEGQRNAEISTRPANRKLVLDCVKRVCSKFAIDSSIDTLLQFFDSVLTFTTRELVERISHYYDQVLTHSESIVGEETAKMLVSVLGTKNVDDFFPVDELFDEIMNQMEPKIETFASTYVGNCGNRDHSTLAAEVYDSLVTLIDNLSSKVIVTDNIGVEQMVKILQNVSIVLANNLRTLVHEIKADTDILCRENMDSFGCDEIVKELMNSIEVPMDDLDIFKTAVRRLDINEIVVDILLKSDHKYAKLLACEVENSRKEIESAEAIFIKIAAKFFDKLIASQAVDCWSISETFKKVVHFIAIKFIEEFQSNRERVQLLKANLNMVGRKMLEQMLKAIGVLGDEKAELFHNAARILGNEDSLDQLIPEFIEYYCKNVIDLHRPKIFEVTISEVGFTGYKITCNSTESDQYYRSLAGTLFSISVKATDPVVKIGWWCIIVESDYNVVSFNFLAGTTETLAILICSRSNI